MINLLVFAFVNDADIVSGHLTSTDITIEVAYSHMQEAIDRWEGGLKATAGALRPDKSFVYPLFFTWDEKGNHTFQNPTDIDIPLTVKDARDTRVTLDQIRAHIGKETIGVFLAPDCYQHE